MHKKYLSQSAVSEWKTIFKSGNSLNKFSAIYVKNLRILSEIRYVDSKSIKKNDEKNQNKTPQRGMKSRIKLMENSSNPQSEM